MVGWLVVGLAWLGLAGSFYGVNNTVGGWMENANNRLPTWDCLIASVLEDLIPDCQNGRA